MPTRRQRIPQPVAKKAAAPGKAVTTPTAPPPPQAPGMIFDNLASGTSAKATLQATLDQYGLGSLASWAWGEYLNGTPMEQITLDTRNRPEYQARFPGMAELSKKGQAISEAQYIQAEQSYASQMRAYGLPEGFHDDPTDFGKLIAGNVSAQEFGDRLQMAQTTAMSDPRGVEMRNQLAGLYGLPNAVGATTAYWINPELSMSLLKQQFSSAQIASESVLSGFGSLTRDQAERVSGAGVTADAARTGFASLSQLGELTHGMVGDHADQGVSRDDLINAALTGDGQAQAKVAKEQRRRQAAFEGGGGFASSSAGVTGLGSAAR